MAACLSFLMCAVLAANPVDGNRLAYLDGHDIYYPHTKFPKLITPQWVGEDGVDAVVILAIDDMRDTAKYESYLRPILQRLKQIDGRAPVSIMTCAVKPDDPQLQTWLQEGVSLEVHTFDHPCPLLQGDLAKAKGTYDKCVDLMFSIPNNTPVAYRMPCCDSLNTVSPRFYKEIFSKTTDSKRFLQVSSSVFQVYTADDPEIPRELLFDADGKERFRKYFPKGLKRGDTTHDRFLNYVENYPYPYIIDRLCWEFPCMTPSDWEANFLHQPNNPQTVADMKAALDITVLKQGVLNLVFHPHGWIQAEQINELIDHAVTKHGKKVKFLTFKEALERLNKNLSKNDILIPLTPSASRLTLLDLDADGYMDMTVDYGPRMDVRFWSPQSRKWTEHIFGAGNHEIQRAKFEVSPTRFNRIITADGLTFMRRMPPSHIRDIDGDGLMDVLPIQRETGSVVQFGNPGDQPATKIKLPNRFPLRQQLLIDHGLRLIDLDGDGCLDAVHSDHKTYGVWLFESRDKGWSIELMYGKRGDKPADQELPPIVRVDGTDNGFFVRDRGLQWINEDTAHLPNLAVSWDFDKLLGDRMPAARTPRAAVESMRVRPGFTVELMAHEPMVLDPVAFQWGPDGKLWVAEMADYPNGMDGRGEPGGRIRFLEDTNSDGEYDKSTLFLEKVPFPNGVHPWKNGVLISAAPDILFAADTDGDGKADVREVLYTGFAEGNQQHRVNGFTWGLDGWLYLANGDSGGGITSTKTGKKLDIRGRDLRIHPETGDMEAIEGQTQFGRNRDDWGHWFGNNNSRPLWHYVLEDRYLSRNPHLAPPDTRRDVSNQPGNAPVFPASKTLTRFNDFHTANRFTSACSAIVDGGEVFGLRSLAPVRGGEGRGEGVNASQGPLTLTLSPEDGGEGTGGIGPMFSFVSEPVHNLVHCEIMQPDGVTFRSRRLIDEQQSEFLASTDNWFRPTQLRVGPDGALWIADMYRLVIEHPQWIPQEWQEKLNVRAGDDKGRLWRVAPTGSKPKPPPRLDKLSDTELVAAMDSPNRWQRDMAQQLLIERLASTAPEQLGCINALMSLIKGSNHPEARVHALYTLRIKRGFTSEVLSAALKDPHPGVRANAVRLSPSLAKTDDAVLRQLSEMAEDPSPWVALNLAAILGEIPWRKDIAEVFGRMTSRVEDPAICTMMASSITRDNIIQIIAYLQQSKWTPEKTRRLMVPLIQFAVATNHASALDALTFLSVTEYRSADAFAKSIMVEAFLSAVSRRGLIWPDWLATYKDRAPSIPVHWDAFNAKMRRGLDDESVQKDANYAEMIRYYWMTARNPEFSHGWLKPSQPIEVQRVAIELAGRLKATETAEQIVVGWPKLSPALRPTARQELLGRAAVAAALLKAVNEKTLTPADIDPETEQFLRSHRDGNIRQEADRVLKRTDANRAEIVANYLRTMPDPGEASQGEILFVKSCAKCHKLREIGHAVGPDLASLSDKSVAALVTAVLDPNRAVEAKFMQFNAITNNGLVVTGVITNETATSVTLLAAEGKTTTLLRSEIDELIAVNKSLMPEGLEKEFAPSVLADLVEFIRGNVPLPVRKMFAGNDPKRITPGVDGSFVLTPATCEIYGPTIVLEAKHGNLGWWSSADDFVVWTIDVTKPGRYAVRLEWACDAAAAGHRMRLHSDKASLTHAIAATDGWDDYRQVEVGVIELGTGPRRLTLRPTERPLPALMDLKSLVLTPK